MIRLFLLATGVLSIVIALLINRAPPDDASGSVTRTDTGDVLQMRDVAQGPGPFARKAVQAPGDALSLDAMTRAIVMEYRRPVTGDRLRQVATTTGGDEDGMRSLTQGVLAGLGAAQGKPVVTQQAEVPLTLDALIVKAMGEGQSDAYVDALLNEAVGSGAVDVPAAIVTSSGEVDTATLLESLVNRSGVKTAPAPAPAPKRIPAKVPTQPAAELAQVAAPVLPNIAPPANDVLIYTVQPGDSLAGIALRHYGTTTAYEIIYQANREKLPSPSAVRPGMTLRIPGI
ncbi:MULTISPECIES: LysM peptidoglycan-binding domain-containing protein [unclassified Marinovum]